MPYTAEQKTAYPQSQDFIVPNSDGSSTLLYYIYNTFDNCRPPEGIVVITPSLEAAFKTLGVITDIQTKEVTLDIECVGYLLEDTADGERVIDLTLLGMEVLESLVHEPEFKKPINVTSTETGRFVSRGVEHYQVRSNTSQPVVLSDHYQQSLAMGRLVLYWVAMEKELGRAPAIVEGGMGIFEGTDTAFLATEDAIMLTVDAFSDISFIAEDGTEHGTSCTSYSEALKVLGC